jgi:uncharacterized RDD family membrane protein YckC
MAALDTPSEISTSPLSDVVPLDRRLLAAEIDIVTLGLLSLGLVWFAGPLSPTPDPLWKPFAVAMGAICAVELFTGHTPGKWYVRVRVRRRDGGPAARTAIVLRGLARLAPVAVFAISLNVRRSPLDVAILFAAFTLACCYVSLCYVMFMRVGLTLFDAVAGTRLMAIPRDGANEP